MKSKKILVYSNGEAIGDGIYKLTFLFNLRKTFPNYKIYWLTANPSSYHVFLKKASNLLIDKIIADHYGNNLLDFLKKPKSIESEYFDIIIDTQKSVFRTILLKKLRHEIFLSATLNFLFSDIKPISRPIFQSLNNNLIFLIKLIAKEKKRKFSEKKFILKRTQFFEKKLSNILVKEKKYIGYAPGVAGINRAWPLENFIKTAIFFKSKGYLPVFFIGPHEISYIDIIKKEIPDAIFPEKILKKNYGVNGSLELVVEIADKLVLCLANDSGTGHMISLSNSHLVSLFSKHNPKKYAALTKKITIIDSKTYGGTNPALIPVKDVTKKMSKILMTL